MTEVTRELQSIHTAQRSFYGKAVVIEQTDDNGITGRTILKSYATQVCTIEHGDNLTVSIPQMHSKTTKRHIREFIIQNFDVRAWDIINAGYSHGKTWWEYRELTC